MAAHEMIFEEDEISVLTEHGLKCGLVLENSEYVSSDEDEEEPPFFERVKKGTIRVAWHPDGKEEVVAENKVKLENRSLMPGDVVRRLIAGQDSQRGYVVNAVVSCTIQVFGRDQVICGVDSKDIESQRLWELDPGDVYLDSWVGKIEKIVESVTLRFHDGARCVMDDEEEYSQLMSLVDVSEKREHDSEFCNGSYYPGQLLKGELGLFERVTWLKTTKHHCPIAAKRHHEREVNVTVESVESKAMEVHWLCRGYAKDESVDEMTTPATKLTGTDIARLKNLNCFEACSIQIGDKGFYTVKDSDKIADVFPKDMTVLQCLDGFSKPPSSGCVRTLNGELGDGATGVSAQGQGSGQPTPPAAAAAEHTCNGLVEEGPGGDGVVDLASPATDERTGVGHDDPGEGAGDADDEDAGEEEEGDGDEGSHSEAGSAASQTGKRKRSKKGPTVQTRLLKKKRLRKSKRKVDAVQCQSSPRPGDRVFVEVIHTVSHMDVMWQDGHMERNIASTELYPIHHLDELEFFPGDFVSPPGDTEADDRYGVVRSVDHAGRTCVVKWLKPYTVGKSTKPDECIVPEEVSVYDIKDHPDYKFRPGHVVVRVGGYEDEAHEDLDAGGQVYELSQEGHVIIQWANGKRTAVYPQDLYLISEEMSELNDSEFDSADETDSQWSHSSGDTAGSWVTEDEREADSDDSGRGGAVGEAAGVGASEEGTPGLVLSGVKN